MWALDTLGAPEKAAILVALRLGLVGHRVVQLGPAEFVEAPLLLAF